MNFKKLNLLAGFILISALTVNAQNAAVPLQDNSAYILTPKPGPKPHINGPKVFGVRPGHPIVFTIPATGTKPMQFSADNLPAGVKLNAANGQLSGSVVKAGTYNLVLHAKNKVGNDKRDFKLVV